MKITRLQAENFKKLKAIEIIPGDGPVVDIRGRNAQGKSSVLDAIMAALGGKSVMPSKPVRSGSDSGAILLTLDDGALTIRRTFDVDGGGQIVVENADGFRPGSPQKMLDSLYASVAFDPLAFTREKPEDQYRLLRGLVKLDVDPDALERANKTDYEARRDTNRDAKQAETMLENMPVYEGIPAEPMDEAALDQKIASAAEHNSQIEARKGRRELFVATIERNKETAQTAAADIDDLEKRLEQVKANYRELLDLIADQEMQVQNAEPLPEPIDISAVQAELAGVRETNRKISVMKQRHAQDLYLKSLQAKSEKLTTAMAERAQQIADAFARAEMPVPGLSFAAGTVLFNGEPFDQASSAEQLRVSTAIGMAGNPKLRVMLVRDGSLLDEDGEKLLAQMAAEHDFQLWVEAVDSSGKVGIVMEDGAVKDAPEPAPIETGKRRKKDSPEAPRTSSEEQEEGDAPSPSSAPRAAESLFGD